MSFQIQLRRDTLANWTSVNPILAQGEQSLVTDTGKIKVGDGSTAWLSLSYFEGDAAWGSITGTLSSQTDLQTALDGKVDENAAITGATKTKITYDAKGLVTAGADATTADIADSSNKRYVTDADLTKLNNLSGTNTGDQDLSGYESLSNKSTNTSLGTSDTLYPSQKAVKVYADAKVANSITSGITDVAPSQDAVFNALVGVVGGTRTISTTAPLSGGGDLTANRTLAISQATSSTDGYLSSSDWTSFDGKPETFLELTDTPSAYTGQADKFVTVNGLETGLGFSVLPVADLTTAGIVAVGTQTISGNKFFQKTIVDTDTFEIGLASQLVVNDATDNTNSINVAFYPTLLVIDDENHSGLNVAGLISVQNQGDGDITGIMAGVSFTAAHDGDGTISTLIGIVGSSNTTAGTLGDITECAGMVGNVEHEGDGEMAVAGAMTSQVVIYGGGDILEAYCYRADILSDDATGEIVDGYILKATTMDSTNKYGVVIDIAGSKNTLHQLTLKAALDVVPATLTDAATVVVDAALSNIFDIELEGNRTLGNPSNPRDGQELIFRIVQGTTGSHTLTLDTKFRFGTTLSSITLSTAVGKTDYLTVKYNLAADKFDVLDFKAGF